MWVTRLSTGAPVAGASVEIRSKPGPVASSRKFVTDAEGFATTIADSDGVIFARSGDDWAYRRYGIAFDEGKEGRAIGMIFTERGIYRPGDSVQVKGIVRQEIARGTSTPAGRRVHIEVRGPEGEIASSHEATLSPFGTFAIEAKVPAASKLGRYVLSGSMLDANNQDSRSGEFHGDFEVAEYRPAEFKVGVEPVVAPSPHAKVAAEPSYVRGDKASFVAHADYLFGAPMPKADTRYTVTRSPASFSPPVPEQFVTGDEVFTVDMPNASPRSNEVASGRAKTDDHGRLSVLTPLVMPGQRGPERVTCETEVTDISRQAIAGSASVIVHPGEFYVALKSGVEYFSLPGVAARPSILAVDPGGDKRTQVPVHVDLVRRTWDLARQAGDGGALHSVVTAVDRVVASCDVTTKDVPQSCALTPSTAGYHLLHAVAVDPRGNKIGAASSFYVTGAGDVGWGDKDDRSVELVADRPSYEPDRCARAREVAVQVGRSAGHRRAGWHLQSTANDALWFLPHRRYSHHRRSSSQRVRLGTDRCGGAQRLPGNRAKPTSGRPLFVSDTRRFRSTRSCDG